MIHYTIYKIRVIQRLKEQMLIVLLKRLADDNGKFTIPIEEVDDTYEDLLEFESDGEGNFIFTLSKKN